MAAAEDMKSNRHRDSKSDSTRRAVAFTSPEPMASPSGSKDVCQTCGDTGTSNLLISCVKCNDSLVHHYCLKEFKLEDDNINWTCDDCVPKAPKPNPSSKSERIILKRAQAIKVRVNWRERLNKNGSVSINWRERLNKNGSVSRRRMAAKGGNINQKRNDAVRGGIPKDNINRKCVPKASEVNPSRKSEQITSKKVQPKNVCSEPAEETRKQLVNDGTFGNQEPHKKRRKLVLEDDDEDEDNGFCSSSSNVSRNTSNCSPPLETDYHFISSTPTEEKKNHASSNLGNQEHRKKRRSVLDDEAGIEKDSAKATNISVSSSSYVSPRMSEYLPSLAPDNNCYAHPSREHIWRVGFGISQGKNKINVGMLVHFQINACSQAFEAASMLPPVLNLEALPRTEIWPKSFQEKPPTDYNIALYFFPESGREEKSFDSLLDDVIEHDLALKASMDHIELLVFSSTELPQQHWRFRKKYYLWGVFKPRQLPPKSSESLESTVAKSSGFSGLKDHHHVAAAAATTTTRGPCSPASDTSHVSNPPSPPSFVHRSSSSSSPESFSFPPSNDGCRSDRTTRLECDEVHQEGGRAHTRLGSFAAADKSHVHFTAHLGLADKVGARRRQGSRMLGKECCRNGGMLGKECCRNGGTSSNNSTISSASGSPRRGVF